MAPVHRLDQVEDLHRVVADAFCDAVEQTLAEQDRFRVSLSGGSTPQRLYQLLAKRDLPWDRIEWFWGDERNVPADHADSNARMVRHAWLDSISAPPSNVHPVPVEQEDPSAAAMRYEATLREQFSGDTYPRWDLVLLGMGDDGHTASLFPHTTALAQQDRWFVENWVEKFGAYRYTLTAPAINSGRRIWFLVAGENKRDALQQVLADTGDANTYPSRLIHPTQWYITADAIG